MKKRVLIILTAFTLALLPAAYVPAQEEHMHEHGMEAGHGQMEQGQPEAATREGENVMEHEKSFYTCPMHPEVRKEEPGECPICGMFLERVDTTGENVSSSENVGAESAGVSEQ